MYLNTLLKRSDFSENYNRSPQKLNKGIFVGAISCLLSLVDKINLAHGMKCRAFTTRSFWRLKYYGPILSSAKKELKQWFYRSPRMSYHEISFISYSPSIIYKIKRKAVVLLTFNFILTNLCYSSKAETDAWH